jgi:hypothetical protein
MSADNGIYIAKFPDGYRVEYAQAIDNCWFYPMGSKERKEELKNYFGASPIFNTKEKAILYAHELAEEFEKGDEWGFLEYGVSYIGEFESFEEV